VLFVEIEIGLHLAGLDKIGPMIDEHAFLFHFMFLSGGLFPPAARQSIGQPCASITPAARCRQAWDGLERARADG
jgi:hypothetical protein